MYAIATAKGPVRLFIPGSASRRIPRKEWEIPLPVVDLEDFAFFPCADVIAFVETKADAQSMPNPKPGFKSLYFEIQLRTLSDGGHHPAARSPAIRRSRGYIDWAGFQLRDPPLVSIASSRLAMLGDAEGEQCLNIWDWRSAQNLFVCQSFGRDLTNGTQAPRRRSKSTVTFLWTSSTITGCCAALTGRAGHRQLLCF